MTVYDQNYWAGRVASGASQAEMAAEQKEANKNTGSSYSGSSVTTNNKNYSSANKTSKGVVSGNGNAVVTGSGAVGTTTNKAVAPKYYDAFGNEYATKSAASAADKKAEDQSLIANQMQAAKQQAPKYYDAFGNEYDTQKGASDADKAAEEEATRVAAEEAARVAAEKEAARLAEIEAARIKAEKKVAADRAVNNVRTRSNDIGDTTAAAPASGLVNEIMATEEASGKVLTTSDALSRLSDRQMATDPGLSYGEDQGVLESGLESLSEDKPWDKWDYDTPLSGVVANKGAGESSLIQGQLDAEQGKVTDDGGAEIASDASVVSSESGEDGEMVNGIPVEDWSTHNVDMSEFKKLGYDSLPEAYDAFQQLTDQERELFRSRFDEDSMGAVEKFFRTIALGLIPGASLLDKFASRTGNFKDALDSVKTTVATINRNKEDQVAGNQNSGGGDGASGPVATVDPIEEKVAESNYASTEGYRKVFDNYKF